MSTPIARIHPTAVVSSEAELAADVTIGPYAVIEGPVRLGPGCLIRPHAHLIGPLVVGAGNDFGTGCVIGDRPQHLKYNNEPTGVVIGDQNIFREHVTVHRGMPDGRWNTVIGHRNLFMVQSHVGHDVVVGNHGVFVNGCMLGGHAVLGDRVLISGVCGVHQNCSVGKLALVRGAAAVSLDCPPFIILEGLNQVVGINVIGMRRAGYSSDEIQAVRAAFRTLYMSGLLLRDAFRKIDADWPTCPPVQELLDFARNSKRGIPGPTRYAPNRTETETRSAA